MNIFYYNLNKLYNAWLCYQLQSIATDQIISKYAVYILFLWDIYIILDLFDLSKSRKLTEPIVWQILWYNILKFV